MALLNNDIELAWSSLGESTDAAGWRSIPIAKVGTCSLRAGRNFPEKHEALLANFASSTVGTAEKLPEGQGFSVTRIDPHNDGQTWLALTRNAYGSRELFAAMVADVVHTMATESDTGEHRLLRVFLGRIRAWQEFMRKGAQSLSPEAEIGLFGELAVLRSIIAAGVPMALAIESWVGPLDGVQDFELGPGAIEAKATLSTKGFPAKIRSLEQLDDATRQPLFLAGARLLQAESGLNLPEMVAYMRDTVNVDSEATRLLSDRLIAAGYVDTQSEHYVRRFSVDDLRVITVDDSFPRLTLGTVPLGVTRALYEIDLDKVTGHNIGFPEALKKLGVF